MLPQVESWTNPSFLYSVGWNHFLISVAFVRGERWMAKPVGWQVCRLASAVWMESFLQLPYNTERLLTQLHYLVKWQELFCFCLSIRPRFPPYNYQSPDVRLMMCIRDVLLSNHSPLNSMSLTGDGRKWLSPELHLTDVDSLCMTRHSETNAAALCLQFRKPYEDRGAGRSACPNSRIRDQKVSSYPDIHTSDR